MLAQLRKLIYVSKDSPAKHDGCHCLEQWHYFMELIMKLDAWHSDLALSSCDTIATDL
jgi:hypothetical protein